MKGNLQFLFIAPERLRVPGFPQMLAKRKPSLIAIDEAHCISQWGHDFRPDYRMLGEYLPSFRPAPALALTATATPLVQKDIATQLGLATVKHLHSRLPQGEYRDRDCGGAALQQAGSSPVDPARSRQSPGHRCTLPPASRRKLLSSAWGREFRVAGYHAGLDAHRRRRVQEEFMSGKLDVMVATTAFGMGIDKADVRTVIHTAVPGSLEGYYQEIGRAGPGWKTQPRNPHVFLRGSSYA